MAERTRSRGRRRPSFVVQRDGWRGVWGTGRSLAETSCIQLKRCHDQGSRASPESSGPSLFERGLLGDLCGLKGVDTEPEGDLAELLEDGRHLLLNLGDEYLGAGRLSGSSSESSLSQVISRLTLSRAMSSS
jgi:hypothetical protein